MRGRPFQKGHTTNKGRLHSEEWKRKMSLIMTGKKASLETREKLRMAHLGMKYGEERNRKLSETQKRIGNRPPSWKGKSHSEETRKIMRVYKQRLFKERGYINTPETREKIRQTIISLNLKGRNSPNWKEVKNKELSRLRGTAKYREWRKHVLQRDDYTCQKCGSKDKKLHTDHELPFALYPDLRFEILNGRVLCVDCHKGTNTYGGRVFVV